jgi:hypothetical protein
LVRQEDGVNGVFLISWGEFSPLDNIKNKKSSETHTKNFCEIKVPKLPDLKKKKKTLEIIIFSQ